VSNRQPSLGRRVLPAFALTAVGVGMVQALDRPSPGPATTGTLLPSGEDVGTTVVSPTSVAPPTTSSGNVASSGGTVTATTPQTAPPQTTAAPSSGGCGAFTGTGSETPIQWNRQYGVVKVSVKFTADGTLCKASAVHQTFDSRSERYESYAIPILNQQAMSAKSANIQGISGATAVSEAYARSLQSAIDNKR
jgi:uncharacterized protein with FMN-binding domain